MFQKLALILCVCAVIVVPANAKSDVVAKVGREKITLEELEGRLAQFPEESQAQLQKKENKIRVLEQMIDEEILYQKARKAGYQRKPEYKDQIANAKRQLLIAMLIQNEIDANAQVTNEDVQSFYNQNRDSYAPRELRSLSHILVGTKKEADSILAQLKEKKYRNFEALAKEKSLDSSKENSGKLGWVSKEQLVPEFGNVAFALSRPGRVSGIVKSQYGYHIIRFDDKKMTPAVSFEQAREQIYQNLLVAKRQSLYQDLIAEAKNGSKRYKTVTYTDKIQ